MNEQYSEIKSIALDRLRRASAAYPLNFAPPATSQESEVFERQLGGSLSDAWVEVLSTSNGWEYDNNKFYTAIWSIQQLPLLQNYYEIWWEQRYYPLFKKDWIIIGSSIDGDIYSIPHSNNENSQDLTMWSHESATKLQVWPSPFHFLLDVLP